MPNCIILQMLSSLIIIVFKPAARLLKVIIFKALQVNISYFSAVDTDIEIFLSSATTVLDKTFGKVRKLLHFCKFSRFRTLFNCMNIRQNYEYYI